MWHKSRNKYSNKKTKNKIRGNQRDVMPIINLILLSQLIKITKVITLLHKKRHVLHYIHVQYCFTQLPIFIIQFITLPV